jgi:hypothetical protein
MRRITTARAARVAACTSAIVGFALSSAGLLGACSSSGSGASEPPGNNDASTGLPANDGAPPPAADDADAGQDAGPRFCSDDGFCPTVVPEGPTFAIDGLRLSLRGVWGDRHGVVWATSVEGDIIRWDGTSWKKYFHDADTDTGLLSIFGTGPTDIWVPTDQGLLHGTGPTSDTVVFTRVSDAVLPGDDSIPITSVWGTAANDLWAVGGNEFDGTGRALHYDGTHWKDQTELSVDHSLSYRAVWGSAGSGVWVYGISFDPLGWVPVVLHRPATSPAAWDTVTFLPNPPVSGQPAPEMLFGAALSADDSIWLSGGFNFIEDTDKLSFSNQYYWHGTKAVDGGFDFTQTMRFTWERTVRAFWGTAPNDTWAIGNFGLVQHWDGTTWKPAAMTTTSDPVVTSFYGIWGTSSTDFWVVGDGTALHKTTAGKP